jgi:hypothetical protein
MDIGRQGSIPYSMSTTFRVRYGGRMNEPRDVVNIQGWINTLIITLSLLRNERYPLYYSIAQKGTELSDAFLRFCCELK